MLEVCDGEVGDLQEATMELHHWSYAKQRRYYRVFWTKMDFYVESEDKYVRDQITKFETVYL